jgi:hypothetical protein
MNWWQFVLLILGLIVAAWILVVCTFGLVITALGRIVADAVERYQESK